MKMCKGGKCAATLAPEDVDVVLIRESGDVVPCGTTHVYIHKCALWPVELPPTVESIGLVVHDDGVPDALLAFLETTDAIRAVQIECDFHVKRAGVLGRQLLRRVSRNAGITDLALIGVYPDELPGDAFVMPAITRLLVRDGFGRDIAGIYFTMFPLLVSFESLRDGTGDDWCPDAETYRAIDAMATLDVVRGICVTSQDQSRAFCAWVEHTRVGEIDVQFKSYDDDDDEEDEDEWKQTSVAVAMRNAGIRQLDVDGVEQFSHHLLK